MARSGQFGFLACYSILMSLKDVLGQEKALNLLRNSIRTRRVASSYLFQGLSGIGKRFTALNFAKALNCLSDGPEACDNCPSCRKIDSDNHPDVILVEPVKGKVEGLRPGEKEKDKKGNREIKIDQIRMLTEKLSLAPFEARYKVAIIDEAELINEEAANAFLKTLEEPPSNTVLVLISTNPETLPETVRSRCISLAFKPLGEKETEIIIKRKFQDPVLLKTLVRLSMGRPGLILKQDISGLRKDFLTALLSMTENSRSALWADKDDIRNFLDMCSLFLRDMLVCKISGEEELLINSDMAGTIKTLSKGAPAEVIIESYGITVALRGNLEYNPNKNILWNYLAAVLGKLKMNKEVISNA